MRANPLHSWDLTPRQAVALQNQLRDTIEREDRFGPVRRVAGVDVGFEQGGEVTRAAVVVLGFPGLEVLETSVSRQATRFPYVPGLLSFREIPALIKALEALRGDPDLLICDGQGVAHPRRFGIAAHLGLLVDCPAIGVGKTRLIGHHPEPPLARGAWVPLLAPSSNAESGGDEEIVGAVLRTRQGVKPVYVSTGHRVGLESAIRLVMACTPRYRLPEPIRRAHRSASGQDSSHGR